MSRTQGSLPPIEDPLWYKDAVIYQLHLKSFFDGNNDGVGDFVGLLQKLDYIAELGVTAIWLLPFYPSPRRDDGYDIGDYRGVHPEYGTLADVRRFIHAAHDRGLRVITELVVNHTSDQHPWFQRARRAKPGSAARDFYVWSDTDQKYAGTRIIFLDTEKSNWTWDAEAGAYFWHRFYSHQPDLNYDNPRVLQEVLSVMRFWLDLGVDGLRLDAVPYLVEREGTNNENLPETHAILRRMRAELDAHAPGRMLLAEANQWPEDAQQYFGDGDECHMSFHFPLMPRMYMAIAREDRFPITDIMRQTPEIPAACQWAIFLRNHDELTLEMVTDAERDYLWETYATDRRARLNLGIRRRLAPLLERDRRRIELMNGLLLSMPGTPVIYYGDEIGMGDNIHVGDRDGVRTPMQWSIDRNGGFSRADPAALVLPPIMDPMYGFQAVNVEAQAADPHSLLNWMRRMLAVRRRFRSFGRGALRFLYPGNRKVLAYVRELAEAEAGETILCVCNLSRSAQAVELDLASYVTRVPLDMVGGSSFPPIGQLPYLLTLPPYGFFWFLLAAEAQMPAWHTPAPEPLPEQVTLVLRHGLDDILLAPTRTMLEHDALPAYVGMRRWFADKDARLDAARIAYAVPLGAGDDHVLFSELDISVGGRHERYAVPLGIAWEDGHPNPLSLQLALARVRRGRRIGVLTDAFALDAFSHGVITGLRDAASIDIPGGGKLCFLPTHRMAELQLPPEPEIRRLSAEQSNSSLVIGDAAVLKIVRHVSNGIHPEAEMTRHLTERGFSNIAPLLGEVTRLAEDGTPSTLVLLQGFVRNQGDGWGWTQDFLHRVVDELTVTGASEHSAETDVFTDANIFATAMGRRLGELHAVLSEPDDSPDFNPAPADAAERERWAASALGEFDSALALLGDDRPLSAAVAPLAFELRARADLVRAAISRLARAAEGALCTRVHGDFHLGQVLVVQADAYIIDFEGEPARPMAERRARSNPLRDAAGLLRSFDYAAAAAEPGRVATSPQASERRAMLLQRYRMESSVAFLDAYVAVLRQAAHPWAPESATRSLLDLFLIEKAAYEVRYEAANRPAWIGIPVRGLAEIAARVLAESGA